jgi:hypothetical protein
MTTKLLLSALLFAATVAPATAQTPTKVGSVVAFHAPTVACRAERCVTFEARTPVRVVHVGPVEGSRAWFCLIPDRPILASPKDTPRAIAKEIDECLWVLAPSSASGPPIFGSEPEGSAASLSGGRN